ncbi:MBL fold metallo-hydrolase [Streptomyces spinoverrucosus]|uniref:MBL fold metallo-hydrolase n=1 Tax=Streptomyces spinoverrucosus TaxID=284043 RepID=UPI0018C3F5C7|nr:MBL fold metallo-hydrolase [Streptomyces spinoverrucosus]MBG0850361.1 MBL fold metallo-hydrolase [Streptomyces spinoverrucosus]
MPHLANRSRITVGATTITYVPDGYGAHNPDVLFPGVDWTTRPGHLEDGRLVLSFGSFLIRAGDRKILVDLAAGKIDVDVPGVAQLKSGALLRSLAAEGLSAGDIDTVVYTHLHLDHVGWTSDVAPLPNAPAAKSPTGLTFGRARHLMSEDEWQYWSTRTGEMGGPDAEAVLKPLDGVVEFVKSGDAIAPGVTVEATPGHTPGHLAIVVSDPSGVSSESVYIAGDILHSPAQIPDPALVFSSDVAPDQARAVRDRVLKRPDTVIAAGHFTGGVFGRVTSVGDAHVWTPVGDVPPSR